MRLAVLRRVGVVVLALGFLGSMGVSSALAASITVNSLADVAANDGACTLSEAITAANTDTASGAAVGECAAGAGADAITFGVAGTITLTAGLPTISTDLSIAGAGAITVSGASSFRAFHITAGTVSLSGITVSAGMAVQGGGILSGSTLTVTNSTFSGNTGSFGGGGIYNLGGDLTVANSTFSGNSADRGGGIYNAGGTLTVANSAFSGNTAVNGGGIYDVGTASVTNSTISGNTATSGGGIFNGTGRTLTVTNSTLSGNTATFGGGGLTAQGTETLVNTIIAGNTAPVGADIDFVAETITTSVIGVPGGKTLADILVPAGLADNGGPTQTIALALVVGNPAIDAGTASVCAAAPVYALDQRGLPRPSACDIGAYEAQPPTVAAHANVAVAVSPPAPTVVTFTSPAGTDEQGGVAAVACLPASGSTFAVGTTTVTCTATDAVGHTASGSFQVIVSAVAAPSPPAPSLPNSATISRTSVPPDTRWVPALFALLAVFSLVALWRVNGRARDRSG